MWQPANKAALPSLEDFKHARRAISELEDDLKDALAALERAQSRVTALTKDLDERKAWIAPIRKLPSELLSEIFIFESKMEHLGPVKITEVCSLWRAVVLATPQAWSLIYTNAPEHQKHLVKYVSTFLERSKPCLLHVWIADELDEEEASDDTDWSIPENKVLPLFLSSFSRIECLSIESHLLVTLKQESMPNLTRLWITDLDDEIPPFFINQSQFPRLRSIQSTGRTWGASQSLTSFPPLQELAVQINEHSTWLEVVKNCSATLKALTLVGHLHWTERVTITFPQLENLSLSDWSDKPQAAEWSITMVTPALISYDDFTLNGAGSRSRHGDLKSVINLRTNYVPDLVPYSNLRMLRLSPSYKSSYTACAGKLAEQLKKNVNACPALQLVELYISKYWRKEQTDESKKKGIVKRITRARPGIEVVFTPEFKPKPGSMHENQCGAGMPCVEEYVDIVED